MWFFLFIFFWTTAAMAVDPTEFPEMSLSAAASKSTPSAPILFARVPGFSFRGRVTGGTRALTPSLQDFISTYQRQYGNPLKEKIDLAAINLEIAVWDEVARAIFWLPVPTSVAQALRREPGPSDRVRVYVRQLGATPAGPIYVIVDFQLLPSETTKERASLPTHSWQTLCETISCSYRGTILLNPPYEFQLRGKFTGKSRLVLGRVAKFFEGYERTFPGALFATATEITSRYSHEAEFQSSQEKKRVWLPLTLKDRNLATKKYRQKAVTVLVSVYGNTDNAMTYLANEVSLDD